MTHSWRRTGVAVGFVLLAISVKYCSAQFFDSKMDDKTYLDRIQKEVIQEVEETKAELMDQAAIIQQVTKTYIAAKLKQNLFKALRVLAEKELSIDSMTMQDRPRQPRQDEEGEGGSDSGGDEDSESATRRPSQILPQVANLIKAVFGGNINLTSYVESAATFLPKPIGNQLVGVVKLISNNPGHQYTTTSTTAAPGSSTTVVTTQTPSAKSSRASRRTKVTKLTTELPQSTIPVVPSTGLIEDEDEYRGGRSGPKSQFLRDAEGQPLGHKSEKQLQIPGLDIINNLGSSLGNLLNANNNNNKNNIQTVNATSIGSGEEVFGNGNNSGSMMSGIDVGTLAKEVRNGLGDLIRIMPDLFRGAREAFSLLTAVTRLFSSFGN